MEEVAKAAQLPEDFRENLGNQLSVARVTGGAFELFPRLVVRLSGQDAFRYLNGQVTRDLSRLSQEEAVPACLLTPRGKLCAPLLIRRDTVPSQDLLVEADPSLEETLLARLERYIVADDVTLAVESPKRTIHLFGEAFLGDDSHALPGIRVERLGVCGRDLEADEIPGERLPPLLDDRVLETLRIERGIPRWGHEMNEETLPPEVGLDRTHIDYDRGCYPGQEVISRIKSIGRVNRHLHRLISAPGVLLRSGMTLLNVEGKELGVISSAAEQFDTDAWVALAILPKRATGTSGTSAIPNALFAFDPLTGENSPLSIVEITGP